jgi:UDP-N-acetylmuramoylalanine-D-glutamate ligase
MSYDSLADTLVSKVKHLILLGQTSGIIEVCLMQKLVGKFQGIDIRITHCSNLKQAVDCAYLSAKTGDFVLLAPASNCTSGNYEELKEIFNKYVTRL